MGGSRSSASPGSSAGPPLLGADTPPAAPAQPAVINPIQIQIRAVPGGNARIQIQNNNGNKRITVTENGKKVEIEETAAGKITVKVTETVDGKPKTTETEAKSAEELKKKNEDVYKLYEKYAKRNVARAAIGGIQLRAAQAFRIGRVANAKTLQQLEEARQQLEKTVEMIRKLAESKASPDDLKKMADELESAKKKLDEIQQQLKR